MSAAALLLMGLSTDPRISCRPQIEARVEGVVIVDAAGDLPYEFRGDLVSKKTWHCVFSLL